MDVDALVLWFNPRCSKCQKALEMLKARGLSPRVRDYQADPPSAAEIEALLRKLGGAPSAAVRNGEDEYGASGLTQFSSPQQVAQAIAKAPVLLQRPILETATRAVIGRPPEKIAELL